MYYNIINCMDDLRNIAHLFILWSLMPLVVSMEYSSHTP